MRPALLTAGILAAIVFAVHAVSDFDAMNRCQVTHSYDTCFATIYR